MHFVCQVNQHFLCYSQRTLKAEHKACLFIVILRQQGIVSKKRFRPNAPPVRFVGVSLSYNKNSSLPVLLLGFVDYKQKDDAKMI